jgi:hypothetical protein
MMPAMRILLFLFAILLMAPGCGPKSYGTGVSGDGSIPPRPAGATYPNWEHLCVGLYGGDFGDVLDRAGAEGWELVAIANTDVIVVCFKRPAAQSPQRAPENATSGQAPGSSAPAQPPPQPPQ